MVDINFSTGRGKRKKFYKIRTLTNSFCIAELTKGKDGELKEKASSYSYPTDVKSLIKCLEKEYSLAIEANTFKELAEEYREVTKKINDILDIFVDPEKYSNVSDRIEEELTFVDEVEESEEKSILSDAELNSLFDELGD